jgi:hypothetical protein
VAKVGTLARNNAFSDEIGQAALEAAQHISAAIKIDLKGAADLTDEFESLADILSERSETQFTAPDALIHLALHWNRRGEDLEAAALIQLVLDELNRALPVRRCRALAAQSLSLAYCAKAELHEAAGEHGRRLLAVKKAWDTIQKTNRADFQWFVSRQYWRVLKSQGHAKEAVQAAEYLANQYKLKAGPIRDWRLLNWPRTQQTTKE